MTQSAPLLSDEQKQRLLAWKDEVRQYPVEKSQVRRFAEAIGDPNPLWMDEVAARKSAYGGLIAPPTFLRSFSNTIPVIPELQAFNKLLDAGSEWEYGEPVRVGDTITSQLRVRTVLQRNLAVGPAVFVGFEVTYTNQFAQVVATQRSTLIWYQGA
jgi:acyl dehydratase